MKKNKAVTKNNALSLHPYWESHSNYGVRWTLGQLNGPNVEPTLPRASFRYGGFFRPPQRTPNFHS
jgi:hypothetical protein